MACYFSVCVIIWMPCAICYRLEKASKGTVVMAAMVLSSVWGLPGMVIQQPQCVDLAWIRGLRLPLFLALPLLCSVSCQPLLALPLGLANCKYLQDPKFPLLGFLFYVWPCQKNNLQLLFWNYILRLCSSMNKPSLPKEDRYSIKLKFLSFKSASLAYLWKMAFLTVYSHKVASIFAGISLLFLVKRCGTGLYTFNCICLLALFVISPMFLGSL